MCTIEDYPMPNNQNSALILKEKLWGRWQAVEEVELGRPKLPLASPLITRFL